MLLRIVAGTAMAAAVGVAGAAAEAERDLSQPVVFASTEVSFPYHFRDRDGQIKGFAIDITHAVTRAMSIPMTRVVLSHNGMAEALRAHQIDVVEFWAETDDRRSTTDFSVPIARFETVVVVRKNDTRIQHLSDLAGKRVAIGQRGTVGHRYLESEQPRAIPVFTETSEEYLRMLSAGEIDAAVMSRLTAVSMTERFGLKNLTVLGDRIPGAAYDVRYCFAVRRGDTLLLARLNEGLAVIHRTGEFDQIYRRWFGRYEPRTFSPLELVSYVAAALALACAAVTWGLLRQRSLSRRVARQAAELSEQRSLLAALHEKHPLATVIFEVPTAGAARLVSMNAEAIRLLGLDPKLELPRTLDSLNVAPDVSRLFADALGRAKGPADRQHWEAKLAGGQRLLEAALVPLGQSESGAPRLCLLYNDVTQRRLMDHELAQSRRLRALGELVGGIAHEFNNLLTPIIVTTSQARANRSLNSQVQTDYQVIDNAARRAAELTKRLLTFGRKNDERPQPTKLRDTVENCFALLRPTVDRRVEWSIEAPGNLAPLLLNPTDLNQIVFNLVINARDTLLDKLRDSRDGAWTPRLFVRVQELGADAFRPARRKPIGGEINAPRDVPTDRTIAAWQQLIVEDNGLGIAPENLDRIFEPFFTTKALGQGTGLGLATVWHLIAEQGGEIAVESKLGEGTRFVVTLPRWREVSRLEPIATTPRPILGSSPGLRILLAEDDPLVTRAALAVLLRAGHEVTHCSDGSDAWARISGYADNFEVLLFDLNMPRLNGIDLIRRVRGSAFHGSIAVISGRVSDDERQILEQLRVDRIILKPFSAADLIDAMRSLPASRRAVRNLR